MSPSPFSSTAARRLAVPVLVIAAVLGALVSCGSSAPYRTGSDGDAVFDDSRPAIANLDPALLAALRRAAGDAEDDGVEIEVTSGWRSKGHQRRLFEEAVAEHGSEEEAARWVARPGTSVHESGDAVDLGPERARAWLSQHGAGYGLCQVYDNEPWHFELRPEAAHLGCPARYADPTRDPRMHQ